MKRIAVKAPNVKELAAFLLSLDAEYNTFTPYGRPRTAAAALKTARGQLSKPASEQKPFGLFFGGQLAGFGFLKFFSKPEKASVCTLGIVVSRVYQRRGFGKALVKAMLSWAKRHGYKKVWLTVYSDNPKAIELYKKAGFQIEGVFMHDEATGRGTRHSLSMALLFGRNGSRVKKERNSLFKKWS